MTTSQSSINYLLAKSNPLSLSKPMTIHHSPTPHPFWTLNYSFPSLYIYTHPPHKPLAHSLIHSSSSLSLTNFFPLIPFLLNHECSRRNQPKFPPRDSFTWVGLKDWKEPLDPFQGNQGGKFLIFFILFFFSGHCVLFVSREF